MQSNNEEENVGQTCENCCKLRKRLEKSERQLEKANNYNEDLRLQLDKLSSELHAYRSKTKNKCDVGIQIETSEIQDGLISKTLDDTNGLSCNSPETDCGLSTEQEPESLSIAEVLKNAAEEAVQQTGYVYDEQSGLYYNYNTGYYYDSERALYYNPETGTYYYYDATSETYQFHSQVDLTQYAVNTEQQPLYQQKQDKDNSHSQHDSTPNTSASQKKQKRKSKFSKVSKSKLWKKDKEIKIEKTKEIKTTDKSNGLKENQKKRRERLRQAREQCSEENMEVSHAKIKSDDEFLCNCPESVMISDPKKEDTSTNTRDSDENNSWSSNICSHCHKQKSATQKSPSFQGHFSDDTQNAVDYDFLAEKKFQIKSEKNVTKEGISSSDVFSHGDDKSGNDDIEENSDERQDSLCTGESELESGELTDSSVEVMATDSLGDSSTSNGDSDVDSQDEDIVSNWPPCIRLMVTDSDCLDPGSLYIITCDGAKVGRENGVGNSIIIPDVNISKIHADIKYCKETGKYTITDCGSQNGTFLNESRISETKLTGKETELAHGDTLQFGCTRFLLHIHSGSDTCDQCEPGLVQASLQSQQQKEIVILSKEDKKKQQRQQLNQIKKKYGLKNIAYTDNMEAIHNPNYKDKAEERRKTKGSDNPYQQEEMPASVHRPITETNVGHKLLKKMGWKEGESLGKDNEGIQNPIDVTVRANQKAGLGSSSSFQSSLDNVGDVQKTKRWLKAQQRYEKTDKTSEEVQHIKKAGAWVQGETQHKEV